MASLKSNLIEFGVTFVFLVIFVALLAIAEDVAGDWKTLVYLGAFVAFTIAIGVFGLTLAPHMYDQYS